MEVGQSIVGSYWKCHARSFFLGLCLLQSASYAHASQDLATAEQGNAISQPYLDQPLLLKAPAKTKVDTPFKIPKSPNAQAQLKALESANGGKYSGGLSEVLASNKDKGLDWFKGKIFELNKASAITMCSSDICYISGFNGASTLGVTQEKDDFNGRQLQGQFVQVVSTDQSGTLVVTRLTIHKNVVQKPSPEKSAKKPSLAATEDSDYDEAQAIAEGFEEQFHTRAAEGWTRPPSARNGLEVELQIGMIPDGTVTSVFVSKSSTDGPFDASAVAAVKNIRRMTEMQDLKPSDFQPYRSFKMIFTPENLAL